MQDLTLDPSTISQFTDTEFQSDFSFQDRNRSRVLAAVLLGSLAIGGGTFWYLSRSMAPVLNNPAAPVQTDAAPSAKPLEANPTKDEPTPFATGSTAVEQSTATAETKPLATSRSGLEAVPVFGPKKVHFGFNETSLDHSTRVILNEWAKGLKEAKDYNLQIDGHADERGTRAYNKHLGQRRAAAVKRYLVHRGVAARRLKTRSFGETRPLAKGHSRASWAKNRRVEMKLIKKQHASH